MKTYPAILAVLTTIFISGSVTADRNYTPEGWEYENARYATCDDIERLSMPPNTLFEFQLVWISQFEEKVSAHLKQTGSRCDEILREKQDSAKKNAQNAPYKLAAAIAISEENRYARWLELSDAKRVELMEYSKRLELHNSGQVSKSRLAWLYPGFNDAALEEYIGNYIALSLHYSLMDDDPFLEWAEKHTSWNTSANFGP